ncbi:tetratricopeptide repeat protein [Sedimenticola hydrogenitrophicus]|uniref:tetratricopeptide repeat protein n=1 Tax=Sedimenticola hydrogenitrophicus TaxID=2967975 RepID=UPI0023AFF325|nr:hypothetical protein [Sedimenticola hydrogenitrophicus]
MSRAQELTTMQNDECIKDIRKRIEKIRSLYDRKQYDLALVKSDEFISIYPEAWVGYREKADILEASRRFEDALSVRRYLAEFPSEEPSDFYDLARLSVSLGLYREAITAADRGIALCEDNSEHYYFQALYFYKSFALVKTQNYKDAIQACMKLEDDYGTHITSVGMVHRADIVTEAKNAIERMAEKKKLWKFEQSSGSE